MADGERKAIHVSIEGRVQGVWYRGWAVAEAKGRNLDGWVRNRSDGTVEAVFAGPPAVVDQMVAACWKGPQAASVLRVVTGPADDPGTGGFDAWATL